MAAALTYLRDVSLTFGGSALFDGVDLSVAPRARIALVGRNGSGKSTLMKIAAGLVEADAGERYVDPAARIAYLPQEPDLTAFATVEKYVAAGLGPLGDAHEASRLIEEAGLAPEMTTPQLSGGEARRAAIARLFASQPDVMLVDEPTNHLDLPAIEWLEEKFRASPAAIVLISHDRRFLETLTTRTVWIDRGRTRELSKGFKAFEAWRDKLLEEEADAAHKLDRKIVAEEHWVRYGVTARRKRNVRRMAELAALRQERRERRKAPGAVKFALNQSGPSSKRVIKVEGVGKAFGERTIVRDFSIEIARGDRIGLVGPNGAGKTTLLNLMTGALEPDEGTVEHGANLDVVSLDQRRALLKPQMRVADAIADGRDWVEVGGARRHVATYLQDFLFSAEQWRSPVEALSGGERGRLALAAALARPSNLLVLDEPTNDLDLETLDLLEELLADYQGTLLLVSHDRSFLDRCVTSIVTTDPAGPRGAWREYVGGYDDMVRARAAADAEKASKPTTAPAARSAGVGKAAPPEKPSVSGKKSAAKLSFKEKHALEGLPGEIARLEDVVAKLREALGDPSLFETDAARFNKLAAELSAAEARLEAAEEEWLALELKREDLEG